MKSMTGYGRAQCEIGSLNIEVEVKSINNKFLRVTTRLPNELNIYEPEIKKIVAQKVKRGSILVYLKYEKTDGLDNIKINKDLIKYYYNEFSQISLELGLPLPTLREILKLPRAIEHLPNQILEENWDKIKNVVEKALNELNKMREEEGKNLLNEIIKYVNNIEKYINEIETLAPVILKNHKEKLKNKIKEIASIENLNINMEEINKEIIFLIEKLDITEEIVRTKSHIKQLRNVLEDSRKNSEAIGKKIDFILQEIIREINTISSKANDAECSAIVIELKSNVEKIREQIQNIE